MLNKSNMGYISETELDELVNEENLAGGTTWGCATLALTTAIGTAIINNIGTTNVCTKSCKKF